MRRPRRLCQYASSACARGVWTAAAIFAMALAALLLQACAGNGSKSMPVRTGGASESEKTLAQCNARVSSASARPANGADVGVQGHEANADGFMTKEGLICMGSAAPAGASPFYSRYVITPDRRATPQPSPEQRTASTELAPRGTFAESQVDPSEAGGAVAATAGQAGQAVAMTAAQTVRRPPTLRGGAGAAARPVEPRARMGVRLRPVVTATAADAPIADELNEVCGRAIATLFRSRFNIPLDLVFVSLTGSAGRDPYQPRLELAAKEGGGFAYASWPSASSVFDPAWRPPVEGAREEACAIGRGQQDCVLLKRRRRNDAFCKDLAKMTGHWLGLSDPKCADPGSSKDLSFMQGSRWGAGASPAAAGSPGPAQGAEAAPAAAVSLGAEPRPPPEAADATGVVDPKQRVEVGSPPPPAPRTEAQPDAGAAEAAARPGAAAAQPPGATPASRFWELAKMDADDYVSIFAPACPELKSARERDRTARPPQNRRARP